MALEYPPTSVRKEGEMMRSRTAHNRPGQVKNMRKKYKNTLLESQANSFKNKKEPVTGKEEGYCCPVFGLNARIDLSSAATIR